MKKTLIATLLILAIATTSAFAVTDSFTVTTKVAELGHMKVTKSAISESTLKAFDALEDFTSLGIKSSGEQKFDAYMTTLSNKRSGYTVDMKATAMTSTVGDDTSFIDYTVSIGDKKVTTKGADEVASVTVAEVKNLKAITGTSLPIQLSIDKTTFDAAVSGDYLGTVTFTFSAT
ncbi:MAG: hypothetical protein RBR15_17810 [Sphaerochaeta sp.]|nr:hypothetical protein [Sphaerochaeta sp.]